MKKTIEELAECFAVKNVPQIENMVYESDEASILDYITDKTIKFAKDILSHQWRSVEDELPEEGEWVIIYAGDDGIQTAVWNEHYQCWGDDEGDDVKYEKDVVTHWMSVPEPPSTDNFQP